MSEHLLDLTTLDLTADCSDPVNEWVYETCMVDPEPHFRCLTDTFDLPMDYGLLLGQGPNRKLHPTIPRYTSEHIWWDLPGCTITQKRPVWKAAGQVVDARFVDGARLLKSVAVKRLEVDCGFQGSNVEGKNSVGTQWERCIGTQLAGVQSARLTTRMEDVHADFLYLAAAKIGEFMEPCRDIEVIGSDWHRCGRQGVTMNSVDGYHQHRSKMRAVKRWSFDSEPAADVGECQHVVIGGNEFTGGNMGFFRISGSGLIPVGDIEIRANELTAGPLVIDIPAATVPDGEGGRVKVRRPNLTIEQNRSAVAFMGKHPLIKVGGWDHVTVRGNVQPIGTQTGLSARDCTDVTDTGNTWNEEYR